MTCSRLSLAGSLPRLFLLGLLFVGLPARAADTAFVEVESDAPARVRILVVDLKGEQGVTSSDVNLLGSVVTAKLARYPRAEVISGADIREMIELEAEKQVTGCDDDSCLSEIAGALGAEYLVTGQVGKLGGIHLITLNLIHVARARAVGRATVELKDLSKAPAALEPAVASLVESIADRLGPVERSRSFGQVVADAFTWTGYTLGLGGLGTLLGGHALFVMVIAGLDAKKLDPGGVPLLGPFLLFLGEDPSSGISDVSFACCSLQLCSCGAILCAPSVLATGFLVGGMSGGEELDAAAAARSPPPPNPALGDEGAAGLASSMSW